MKVMKNRFVKIDAIEVLDLDTQYRALQTELQSLQKERNEISFKIGEAKKTGQEVKELCDIVSKIKSNIRKRRN